MRITNRRRQNAQKWKSDIIEFIQIVHNIQKTSCTIIYLDILLEIGNGIVSKNTISK